jgi:hypothetical protein
VYISTLKKVSKSGKVHSKLWKVLKKLWNKYRIAKGSNDAKSMRSIEKKIHDVCDQLEIPKPVFLILEVKKHVKGK